MRQTNVQAVPEVSVLCHAYNHEKYIAQALDGILMQKTAFRVEIIVHDDASEDRTPEIIKEYAEKYPDRIVPILQLENQFSLGRRPKRFTYPKAKGRFIALCEGDDFWTSADKLQRQVDALNKHPGIDLCIHSAMRLSVRTGRKKHDFDYGPDERVIPIQRVLARHNQLAPTAAVLLRREAALTMPSWWLYGTPPAGDCFLEVIVGRPGVLYLPESMSVYRRGVPGSYTDGFQRASGEELEAWLEKMLNYTEKLRGMAGVPEDALEQRLSYIRLNYAIQLLIIGDRERFVRVSPQLGLKRHLGLQAALKAIGSGGLSFVLGRGLFRFLRRMKG